LLALGFGDEAIKTRVEAERLQALHREVFAVGHARVSRQGRRLAAVLAYGDEALLSHRSAAALWGLMRSRAGAIDVTASVGRQGIHRRDGIWIHRGQLHAEDRANRAGIPVTTVARTLFDLTEVVNRKQLESAWEEADRLKLLRLNEIEAVCERGYGRRALRPIRRLLAEARAPLTTRSPLEDRFSQFCRKHLTDLPAPLTNISILDHEVDAYWPGHRLVVEMDSWEFHSHRAAFESDRARDAKMQAAGYRVIRLTHRQLETESPRISTQLHKLLGAERPPYRD
jgi:very-short-patch-repair endonuclease